MLLKYCRCGAIIPADRQRCARCEQLHQSRHTAYNAQCRSQKAAAFYVSREWRTIRPVIISIYDGIDIWAFYECDQLLAADEVHHIEELDTAWNRRLDPFNLFPLAHASHTAITAAYKRSPASMRTTQRKLLELRKRYFESEGGYEKVLERAGLVAPPYSLDKTPHQKLPKQGQTSCHCNKNTKKRRPHTWPENDSQRPL